MNGGSLAPIWVPVLRSAVYVTCSLKVSPDREKFPLGGWPLVTSITETAFDQLTVPLICPLRDSGPPQVPETFPDPSLE